MDPKTKNLLPNLLYLKTLAESAVNRDTSPGDCLQINRVWFFQGQDLNFLMIHMGQVSNILYIILLNDD